MQKNDVFLGAEERSTTVMDNETLIMTANVILEEGRVIEAFNRVQAWTLSSVMNYRSGSIRGMHYSHNPRLSKHLISKGDNSWRNLHRKPCIADQPDMMS